MADLQPQVAGIAHLAAATADAAAELPLGGGPPLSQWDNLSGKLQQPTGMPSGWGSQHDWYSNSRHAASASSTMPMPTSISTPVVMPASIQGQQSGSRNTKTRPSKQSKMPNNASDITSTTNITNNNASTPTPTTTAASNSTANNKTNNNTSSSSNEAASSSSKGSGSGNVKSSSSSSRAAGKQSESSSSFAASGKATTEQATEANAALAAALAIPPSKNPSNISQSPSPPDSCSSEDAGTSKPSSYEEVVPEPEAELFETIETTIPEETHMGPSCAKSEAIGGSSVSGTVSTKASQSQGCSSSDKSTSSNHSTGGSASSGHNGEAKRPSHTAKSGTIGSSSGMEPTIHEAGPSAHDAPPNASGAKGKDGSEAQTSPISDLASQQTVSVTDSSDTLKSHLMEVRNEDENSMLVVRRINRLGFRAGDILRAHYESYGPIVKVLVAHSQAGVKTKNGRPASSKPRTRPGCLGIIVFKSSDSARQALADGEMQMINGCEIHVQCFMGSAAKRNAKTDTSSSRSGDSNNGQSGSAGATNATSGTGSSSRYSGRDGDVGSSGTDESTSLSCSRPSGNGSADGEARGNEITQGQSKGQMKGESSNDAPSAVMPDRQK